MPLGVAGPAAVIRAGVLSFFDVKLSAAVLGVALILEVIILAIFGFGVHSCIGHELLVEALNVFNVTTPVAEQKVGEVGYRRRRCGSRHLHGLLVVGRV